MILNAKVAAPLLLAAAVLGAAAPLLQALSDTAAGVFHGPGVYIITQGGEGGPLDGSLVAALKRQPWAGGVSPEAYAPTILRGQGVVIRGIEPEGFAAVEGLRVLVGSVPAGGFVLAGRRLADRLHINVGDAFVLTGSAEPAVAQLTVTAVVATGGSGEDELLVPLRFGAWLAGLGSDGIVVIRVRTSDPSALQNFLQSRRSGAEASGERGTVAGDDRIANLILTNPQLARVFGRPYVGTFARYGLNSVRVALDGFTLFTEALFSLGSAAAIGKELEEGRRRLGLLKALGATRLQLTTLVLREAVPLAGPACFGGVALGLLSANLLGAIRPILLFGHTVVPPLDPAQIVFLGLLALGVVLLASVAIAHMIWRRPAVVLLGRAGDAWSPLGSAT